MNLRRRPLKRSDISVCIDLLAAHPEFTALYQGRRELLQSVFDKIVGSAGFLAFLFESTENQQSKPLGVGALAFLTDEFVKHAKQPPFFWIGPRVVSDLASGKSPILSDESVLRAGALDGLTLYCWPLGFCEQYIQLPEVQNFLMASFIEETRGYKLKEFLGQTTDPAGALVSLHSGALLLTPGGTYTDLPDDVAPPLLSPHLFVITREKALQRVGSWSSSLFVYNPPELGFSRGEQRLLGAALRGLDDDELVSDLQISLSAIKKTWRSIYSRVERAGLSILPSSPQPQRSGDRGKGKKHRLLNYVREHPEELRPIATKLLHLSHVPAQQHTPNAGESQLRHRVGRKRVV